MSSSTPLTLFIAGEWLSDGGRRTEPVVDPATGETLGHLPHATGDDLARAAQAAAEAFPIWRAVSPYERSRILRHAADLLREREDDIAKQMTREQGKVLAESRIEVRFSADTFDWYAEEGRRAYGRLVPSRVAKHRQIVVKEPIGPVAAFSPWNFPTLTPARKIAASLASGCPCVIKPSEETPYSALALARALDDAGLPKGVLNVVFGIPAQVSEYLLALPSIRKITFTGSTPVGKHVARLAADGVKRATLELGGHAPVIVFDDADLELSVRTLVQSKFRNAGQVCIAPTRLYVQERAFDSFLASFTAGARLLRVGNGLEPETQMGPLANPRRLDAMHRLIGDAVDRGAELLAGGSRIDNQGWFFQPTVLANVPDDARIMSEEPFGPVAIINRFRDFDDAVEKANRLPFGLAAYAFTTSHRTATDIGDAIESGMVGINTVMISVAEAPFGGVKESGYGSESGLEGLEVFLNTKFISQM